MSMIKRRRALGLLLLALACAPASADIYSFIDEEGRIHVSDVKLDSRYELYMKSRPAPEAAPLAAAEVEATPESAAFTRPTPLQARRLYRDMIAKVAREQNVDAALLHAVVTVESAYNPHAMSPKGATGLMQLMPDTAKRYGVTNSLDPQENLRGGARYLRDLLAMFNNNLRLVIAAYNAGEGAVIRSGRAIPPYPETRAYVQRVLQHYQPARTRSRI
jgi:soluble lytic murein transglycosylase-like protein